MRKNYLLPNLVLVFFCTMIFVLPSRAQPFIQEIEAFKKQDSIAMPPKNAILFVGSSSFRMWSSLQQDFPVHTIINRGFGGSSFHDLIRYADQIIIRYQ